MPNIDNIISSHNKFELFELNFVFTIPLYYGIEHSISYEFELNTYLYISRFRRSFIAFVRSYITKLLCHSKSNAISSKNAL